ncbi:CamS family sex pheromone protein [Jeotgalibaca sp. MA1X17-3]|uniref:CamS family sex pheromone protein n=1 Tax=Jeotgalibaca sp. MA1X17-3 TaxID=2908211 RepID=UPI001F345331|nr:CamS family sex pheromone protein [Jeotgalibaca sp. MA1X17-3]UJF15451.1 CamS family sex pheromone protein [Jeotgalibaca sp. MA1X17-3]
MLLFLTSCTSINNQPEGTVTNDNTQTVVPVQPTPNQLSDDYYRALIVDGKYQSSQNRGVSLDLNSSVNMKAFETDLLKVAKKVFPTDQYFFQEGQIITKEMALSWINRKSEDNPQGLNPESNELIDSTDRSPQYLSQIVEQDFMIETEKGFELGGIAVGLAMNQIDYYNVKDSNSNLNFYEQSLDLETILKEAKSYGNEIVSRLRDETGVESLPIVVGIFLQSPKDSLASGNYVLEGKSTEGRTVEEWIQRNEKRILFPTFDGEETDVNTQFNNFKNEIQLFFPNLSGVTGVGLYQEDKIISLHVDIMTQFYGQTEIIAFTQQITDAANRYLPKNIEIELKVESINGIEAFLTRSENTQTFNYHVFE